MFLVSDYEDDSEEESGKDWDELEEEARQGKIRRNPSHQQVILENISEVET